MAIVGRYVRRCGEPPPRRPGLLGPSVRAGGVFELPAVLSPPMSVAASLMKVAASVEFWQDGVLPLSPAQERACQMAAAQIRQAAQQLWTAFGDDRSEPGDL